MKKLILVTSVVSLFSIGAFARGEGNNELQKAACSGKSSGESCRFEGRRGEVSGTCSETKESAEILICKNSSEKAKRGKRKE